MPTPTKYNPQLGKKARRAFRNAIWFGNPPPPGATPDWAGALKSLKSFSYDISKHPRWSIQRTFTPNWKQPVKFGKDRAAGEKLFGMKKTYLPYMPNRAKYKGR